jgi:chromosome segregation ATPase
VTPAFRPLLDTAHEYRRQCDQFEQAMEELLSDLDLLRGELEWKAATLVETERELAEQRRENQRLIASLEERVLARPTLASVPAAANDSVPWSEMQLDIAELRRQLLETRDSLTAELSRTESERVAAVAKSQQKLDELQQERAALETELAVARSRTAELHATLAQQEQERAAERERTNDELRQLRLVVEQQTAWLKGQANVPHHERPAATTTDESTPKPAADPVVNSVMAQFAKLQKDVAQRRKK